MRARSRAFIAVLVALAVTATPACAQRAEAPVVNAGDEWRFVVWYTAPSTTPNRIWVVTSVTADRIDGTENGEPLSLTRELNVLDSPRQSDSNPGALRFPLEVGKSWRYRSDWTFKPRGSKGGSDVAVVVVGYERVRVPAGEFDAFRLELVSALSGTSPVGSRYDGQTTATYWYAPAARAIVKWVNRNPYLGPSTVELVDMRPAPTR